jgi:site-specific DNA-methyltransferase (adenine-specific)
MTPYYQDDHVAIYHGDCREVSDWLSGDVLVTDPPYGMKYGSRFGSSPTVAMEGDHSAELRDWALSVWGDKPAIMFGTWRISRPLCKELLIWNKTGVGFLGDLSMPWGPCHEEIYVLGSGFSGRRSSNVLSFDGLSSQSSERPDHPTPKPLPLMRELIGKCPAGTIADPFMGSGSTLRAAKDLGRKAIGIEVDERYCEIAARRMAQEVLPL